ncbi:hypothetical protein [Paenibacillus sp. DCT19]|uniref:hypothetical protein n=1 Tax=Paenibacillus sp. DCT19 TaxID=2211212 RepID=UPI000FE22B38|nr:hypothetical protein [Paenibacillus sp. DCT19]
MINDNNADTTVDKFIFHVKKQATSSGSRLFEYNFLILLAAFFLFSLVAVILLAIYDFQGGM